jgi:hypothetical protein
VFGRVAALLVMSMVGAGLLASCSTGGGNSSDLGSGSQPANYRVLCGKIAQLPDSAALLQRVDVRDPVQFKKVLDEAVNQYVATLDDIAARVEPKLRSTVAEVRKLVLDHKFGEATDARVPLDTWTADNC